MRQQRALPPLWIVLLALAFTARAGFAAAPESVPGELIVKYRVGVNAARRTTALRVLGNATHLRALDVIHGELLRVDGESVPQAIATLEAQPDIEYAEPNYVIHADTTPNDPRFAELYAMHNAGQTGGTAGADIRATSAWDVFTGDPDLKIGVIDTGVDYTHPDLVNNVWTNPGEIPGNGIDDDGDGYVDDVHGYDFVNNDGDPMDDHDHGTHCAGTIAGEGNNGIGVTGVNWHAKIVAIKFLDASGSGTTAGAIQALQYAITVGVRLTSDSWGGGAFSQALLDAINAAGAAGQLFVAAAGNSGLDTDASPSYPASYDSPYVLSVAATDQDDQLASFSNYGLTSVDLGAPGVDILSCKPGGGYQLLSGTSMATPHVAGACGLVWGRKPDATNLQIKQLILSKADPIPALAGKCVTGARLDVFMAIADPDSIPPGAVTDLATTMPGSTTMGLSWTATGDDGNSGRASRYDIRWSTSPIDASNFAAATPVAGPDPHVAGTGESFEVSGLTYLTTYYFALEAADEFGNTGPVSNLATGTTLGIPNIALSPGTLAQSLLTGATADQALTISNTGAGRLDWTVPAPELLLAHSGLVKPVPLEEPLALAKGEADPRPGLLGSGGPDAFGYRWKDSDEPGGPVFDWVDITGTGTNAGVSGDDALSAAIALPFSFPFYGGSFASLRVCSNGFLTFTGSSAPYANSPLPSAGGVANMVAPFWDDQDMSAGGTATTFYDGTRFIVEWSAVPHYNSGGPYTYEAILYPTGEIRFQYQSMAAPTTGATVGIQNATSTVGLNVAFDATYVHDAMAVRIIPLAQWLTVSPSSGRIGAGGSQPLDVHFDAGGLAGGTYFANIAITSNDPDDSPRLAPVTLTVIGAPHVAVTPDSLAFDSTFVGSPKVLALSVQNTGTAALVVDHYSFSDPAYSTTAGAVTIPPLGSALVNVSFQPGAGHAYPASLTVNSDDPATPARAVPLSGVGVVAPAQSLSQASLSITLLPNDSRTRDLTITNGGGSNLYWSAGASVGGTGTSAVAPLALGKGQPDPRQGVLGSGGPDGAGYRWKDSDAPGGPVYDWVDITGVGQPHPELLDDDRTVGGYPLGFAFPFYGGSFSTVNISSNGFLSFTSLDSAYANQPLPGAGASANLVAPYWDDLNPSAAGAIDTYNDGARWIVEFAGVAAFAGGAGPCTFEVLLYPTGRIVYQYLAMGASVVSATIGIQNATQDVGLEVAYNAPYVHDHLAVEILQLPTWLTTTATGGTIVPGGSAVIPLTVSSTGLPLGTFDGSVSITSNDPAAAAVSVPVHLAVSDAAGVGVAALPVRYGLRMAGRNPAVGGAVLELALPATGRAGVAIYDARGARVRTLVEGELPAGFHALRWGGELANGAPAQPGIYFVRAVTAGGTFRQRLAFLR